MKQQISRLRLALLFLGVLTTLPFTSQAAVRASKWASQTGYISILPNHAQALIRSDLKAARLALDAKGRPAFSSGASSTVARLSNPAWAEDKAVRFYHPGLDLADRSDPALLSARYALMGADLARLKAEGKLPSQLVPFEFEPKGVIVKDKIYPIMTMPYIEGLRLDEWVGSLVEGGNSQALIITARAWLELMREIKSAGIAHGDLQHANVRLDTNGGFQLIDPDTRFTPSLRGQPAPENGHPNYHHPAFLEAARPFDEKMDHFSSIVIYTSLLALAERPELWEQFHLKRENLLFEADRDFVDPTAKDSIFPVLLESKLARTRKLAYLLAKWAIGDPADVPSLDEAIRLTKAMP